MKWRHYNYWATYALGIEWVKSVNAKSIEEIFFDSSLPEAVEVKIGFYDLSIFNKFLLVNYG